MTVNDVPRYREAFGRLCAAFGRKADDLQREAWWEVLEDLPIEAVERGMREVARTSSDRFFPRAADVFAAGQKAVREATPQTRGSVWVNPETGLREYVYACPKCLDTGWEPCALSTDGRPGLTPEVAATYTAVRRCICRTSRNVQEVA